MYAGDELYDDELTSGPLEEPKAPCAWCEDWAEGFDPEPCPRHGDPK